MKKMRAAGGRSITTSRSWAQSCQRSFAKPNSRVKHPALVASSVRLVFHFRLDSVGARRGFARARTGPPLESVIERVRKDGDAGCAFPPPDAHSCNCCNMYEAQHDEGLYILHELSHDTRPAVSEQLNSNRAVNCNFFLRRGRYAGFYAAPRCVLGR